MSRQVSVSFNLYSPRWGHSDRYEVTFTESGIEFSLPPTRTATYTEEKGWSVELGGQNGVLGIMSNDGIHPPVVIIHGFTRIWERWLDNEIEDGDVRDRVGELANWINRVTELTPRDDFWMGAF